MLSLSVARSCLVLAHPARRSEKNSELSAVPGYGLRDWGSLILLKSTDGLGYQTFILCTCIGSPPQGACAASFSSEVAGVAENFYQVATCAKAEQHPYKLPCNGSCEFKPTNPAARGFIIR